jgi:hypothetical protein
MRKRISHELSLLCFEILHFVINIQKYSVDGVLGGLWNELIRQIFSIQDFDELFHIHQVQLFTHVFNHLDLFEQN